MAFVGPSYANFDGKRTRLNPADPVEAVLLQQLGANPPVFSLSAGSEKLYRERLCDVLRLMHTVHSAVAMRPPASLRATGRILRDFYMALQAGQRHDAERNLSELEEGRRLDALNLNFLRIRLFAAFQEWHAILAMPYLPQLILAHRPHAITDALISAVYRTYLTDAESHQDAKLACEIFRARIQPEFGELFRFRTGQQSADSLKASMLMAVASDPPHRQVCTELLSLELAEDLRRYLTLISEQLPPEVPVSVPAVDPLITAQTAFNDGNLEAALSLACELPNTISRVKLLLECAYEMQTSETEV